MHNIFRMTALLIAPNLLGVPFAQAADPLNPLELRPHHITATVRDLDRAANWYREMLGFTIRKRGKHGDITFVELDIPGFGVALIKEPSRGQEAPQTGYGEARWLHIVFSVPDPDAAYHVLETKRASLAARRSPDGHIQSFLITDSEGNELEIIENSTR